ncbi:MAG TPA: flagellar biosynthetic protein FliQ [Acidimicrobiales bacterium]|nr:flagellar biosynthetic protein FliQ [Acidimicrobiales bacterium]
MTDVEVLQIATQTLVIMAKLAAPILVVSLAVGVAISMLQSVTQVQEFTLTFVPKLAGIALVMALGGNWMLHELVSFTRQMFDMIPSLVS